MDEADRFCLGYTMKRQIRNFENGKQFKTCVTQMPLKASNPKMIKAAARTRKRFIFIIGQVRRGAELKYKSSSCLAVIYLEFHTASELTRDPEVFDVWHSVCLPGSISADSEWAQATAHTRQRLIMVTGQVRKGVKTLAQKLIPVHQWYRREFLAGSWPYRWLGTSRCLTYFSLPESVEWILFVEVQKSVECPKSF